MAFLVPQQTCDLEGSQTDMSKMSSSEAGSSSILEICFGWTLLTGVRSNLPR